MAEYLVAEKTGLQAGQGGRGWASGPRALGRLLEELGGVVERRGWIAPVLLLALYVPLVLVEAHGTALTNDEIYTVHIARAPTLGRMLFMARETDLHPPLHYLLQRVALHLPGPMWLVSRLPSMLAGVVLTLTVYWLTARRLGALLGLVAVAVVWSSPALRFAWGNRPYMISLALLALLMVAWRRANLPGRSAWTVAAVFLLSGLMIADQLVGIACLLPFVLAEAVRWRQRGRLDWTLLVALLAPSLLGAAYFYQLHHLANNAFPRSQVPTVGWALGVYNALVTQAFFLLSVSVVLLVFLGEDWRGRARATERAGWEMRRGSLSASEWALYLGMLGTPVLLMVVAVVLGLPYWERYGTFAVLGLAGILPFVLARYTQQLVLFSTLFVLVFVGTTIGQIVSDWGGVRAEQRSLAEPPAPRVRLAALDAGLPIVAANPMTFNEMADREPTALAERVYYLTDAEAARHYSGYTLFENEEKIVGILGLPAHAESRATFLAAHDRFYMVANFNSSMQWLPRWLADQGADLDYLGKFASTYEDDDVYLVTMPRRR